MNLLVWIIYLLLQHNGMYQLNMAVAFPQVLWPKPRLGLLFQARTMSIMWKILETTKLGEEKSLISGFRRKLDEICALLGYRRWLPTFRDNLSVPSSRDKKSKKKTPSGISWQRRKNFVLDFLTREDVTALLFQNIGKTITTRTIRCVLTQKSADLKKNVLDQLSDHQGPWD